MTDIKMANETNKPAVAPVAPADKTGGTHKPSDPAVAPAVTPPTSK